MNGSKSEETISSYNIFILQTQFRSMYGYHDSPYYHHYYIGFIFLLMYDPYSLNWIELQFGILQTTSLTVAAIHFAVLPVFTRNQCNSYRSFLVSGDSIVVMLYTSLQFSVIEFQIFVHTPTWAELVEHI